ncbi:SusD/RagB family nutrient-binding outer membrane lipoprotein, partial [uncultured Mucilaginibacter sp.]|uniref:SusD/RagB family nutrient-binding outer membrane lipoprotein n=1 Tax=uncultured Mucilaginibacter sp. TaxID=797541 RepID=UPI0025F9C20D
MKFKNIYLIATAAFIMIAAGSCKKELAKTNTNPDQITAGDVNPNLLLTTVQLQYTGAPTEGGSVWVTKWGAVGCFVQHIASTGGFYYGDKYLNNISGMGQTFQDNYISAVQPVVELYQLTANKPQYRNLHQMARIMKAMIFEQLTDLYGDIPYFQAGLGYYDRIYAPVYDKQQVIYTDLLKEVSQATDSLSETADNPTGDILYSQTADQIGEWKMFGNSLLLRMAMRLTKVDAPTAQKYVTQVMGKTMKSNNDNAIVQHLLSANSLTLNQDAAQIFSQDSVDIRLSSTIISNMKKMSD